MFPDRILGATPYNTPEEAQRAASGQLYSPWLNFGVSPERSTVSFSSTGGADMTDVAAGDNGAFPNRTTRIALAPDARPTSSTRRGKARWSALWGDYEGLTAPGNTFYGVFTGESTDRTTPQLDPIFLTETAEAEGAPKAPKLAPKSN